MYSCLRQNHLQISRPKSETSCAVVGLSDGTSRPGLRGSLPHPQEVRPVHPATNGCCATASRASLNLKLRLSKCSRDYITAATCQRHIVWTISNYFSVLQMSQSNQSSNGSFSSNGKKTNYNKHFPRSFLLNYGPAIQDISEDDVLKRLYKWNCEWLKRPNIAMSEMAMTVKDNLPLIRQFNRSILSPRVVEDLVAPFEAVEDALKKLDNKDKSNNDAATRQDVINVLRTIHKNEALDQAVQDAFNAAGPLMMVSAQLLAIQTLMRNPQDFAEKCSRTPANEHFHSDPTPKRMRDYLLDAIIKSCRPVNRSVSIWDDDEDDDQQPGAGAVPRRRFQRKPPLITQRQPARQRRQNSGSPWRDVAERDSQQDSSQASNSRRNTMRPPAANKKPQKRQKPESSDKESSGDEIFTQKDPSPAKPAKKKKSATKPVKASTPKKSMAAVASSSSSSSSGSSSSLSSEDESPSPPKKATNAAAKKSPSPPPARSAAVKNPASSTQSTAGPSKGKQPLNGASVAKNRVNHQARNKPDNDDDDDDPWNCLRKAAKGKGKKK